MSALALIIAVVASAGWAAVLGTLIYGLVTGHRYIEGMFIALVITTLIAAAALTGAVALLGYEWG
ncbi:Uncharacterised protein [Corynebacterium striatum]|uniref:Uncharacterized protein n=1 Tax=Corynebacterium striatum TaxID=43770 RepID=A0AAQ1Z8L4_CORST|nr:hypothetical protein [Corynebacterium striatum]EEI77684.1 hypothetical protein HMPREF0308_2060 [Corynebacterium striatum ATCC 6940]QQE52056.1 hypothetical protein I6I11_07750 [Corynebacterium striatum]GEA42091.1 hypothetical protein Cst04h_02610 [Corynebacterium striatum]STD63112.1 Uncharacterised protein [Corynebacterium striatum]